MDMKEAILVQRRYANNKLYSEECVTSHIMAVFAMSMQIEEDVVIEQGVEPYCPRCGSGEYMYNEDGKENRYCGQCGQKLNREVEE